MYVARCVRAAPRRAPSMAAAQPMHVGQRGGHQTATEEMGRGGEAKERHPHLACKFRLRRRRRARWIGWGGRKRRRQGERRRVARTGPTQRRWCGGRGRDGGATEIQNAPFPVHRGLGGLVEDRQGAEQRRHTRRPPSATRFARRRRTGSRAPDGRTRAPVKPRTFSGIPHNTTSTEPSPLRTLCCMRRAGSLYEEVFSARCMSTRACSIAELVDLAIGPKIGWTNFEQKPNTSEFCQARRRRSHLLLPTAWVC